MRDQLRLHTVAHLRFYLRSRVILGVGLAAFGIWAVGLVPLFVFESAASRFEQLKYLASETRMLALLTAAAVGLFAVSSHLRNRSTRLVFTRPGARETWIASVFLSAFLVALAIHAAGGLVTAVFAWTWGVSCQVGFLYFTIRSLFETLALVSLLTALGTAVHPVLAVVLVAFFNDGLFYTLDWWLLGTIQAGRSGLLVRACEWAVHAVYSVLPMSAPFAEKSTDAASSLRIGAADWGYLAATGGYSILVSLFFFLLASIVIRRKPLI